MPAREVTPVRFFDKGENGEYFPDGDVADFRPHVEKVNPDGTPQGNLGPTLKDESTVTETTETPKVPAKD